MMFKFLGVLFETWPDFELPGMICFLDEFDLASSSLSPADSDFTCAGVCCDGDGG